MTQYFELKCSFLFVLFVLSHDTADSLKPKRMKVSLCLRALLRCHAFFFVSLSQLPGILSSNALEDTVSLEAMGKCCCNEAGLH